jgi:hypothetical protein
MLNDAELTADIIYCLKLENYSIMFSSVKRMGKKHLFEVYIRWRPLRKITDKIRSSLCCES